MNDQYSPSTSSHRWNTPPGLWKKLKPLAREMRVDSTPAEARLWDVLRNRQLYGFKFRRQHSIERFVVDFYCPQAGLIVEVDGAVHDDPEQQAYDAIRSELLVAQGFRVVRVKNDEVFNDMAAVLSRIGDTLNHQ